MTAAEQIEQTDAAAGAEDAAPAAPAAPLLQIITPGTTPEEVAAIVAVLSALGGGQAPAPAPRPEWTDPSRGHRTGAVRVPPHGRGAWRASALPR